MLKLINTEERTGRTSKTYQGDVKEFKQLAVKLNLVIEEPLKNGTIYACNDNTDLAYRPLKGIRLTIWKEEL